MGQFSPVPVAPAACRIVKWCCRRNENWEAAVFEKRTNPFHTVKYVQSENSRLIQAVDLLSGAVAYETNSLHRAAKPAKHRLDLWSSILQASNLTTFAQPTTDRMNRFQILHFDFEKSAAKRFKPPPPPESGDE